jgi:hypothetical protein
MCSCDGSAGIDLRASDTILITGNGTLTVAGASTGPAGARRTFRDLLKSYPVNEAGAGALIGRIGSNGAAAPFLVGASRRMQAPRAGRLFLAINKASRDAIDGNLRAAVEIVSRGPEAPQAPADLKLPEVTRDMIDRIPRRVVDAAGTPGDNTNFVIVGSERKVLQALAAAGWVKVDRGNENAVIHGILAVLTRQAYLELPMSELLLFGRPQDYGMAHAEPIAVVAQRHHFRIWKAPFTADGQDVWAGAGTHDIGFDRDQRNGGITHKIDPEVDKEREFIGESLNETGMVAKLSYVMPSKPNKEAKTAHGGSFRSDGRLLVIHLMPDGTAGAQDELAFSNLFCTVREKENPDGGRWDGCDKYLETAPKARLDLPELPNKYRVLIVPGFFSACASSVAPPFLEGVDHLRDKHGVTVEVWAPPNDSSEANATRLAEYLRDHMRDDKRKYIVVGYSKGTPDLQVALANEAGVKDAIAAFVSVAGAVGGSAVAEALPAQADGWLNRFKIGDCQGDIATAFRSLRRDVRRRFLAANPNPVVPSYSLAAVSDQSNTSKMLQEAWKLMSVLAARHDSQLAVEDAILPGSKFLGTARADHLAVAMPFEKAAESAIRAFADKGHYPRGALLESIVRFVTADLEGGR